MKQITDIDDPRLVKGMAHPLRVSILRVLQDRIASPSEIAEELGAPLGNVSYHVRFLARVGLIELSGTQPRRGAVEHYYRAIGRVQVSRSAWVQVPGTVRDAWLTTTLERVGRSVSAAASAGGFSHEHAHASRVEVRLDPDGLSDLSAAVADLQEHAVQIERESAARIAARLDVAHAGVESAGAPESPGAADDSVDETVRTELVLMLFGAADA